MPSSCPGTGGAITPSALCTNTDQLTLCLDSFASQSISGGSTEPLNSFPVPPDKTGDGCFLPYTLTGDRSSTYNMIISISLPMGI